MTPLVVVVVGTRPEAIKLAPVILALRTQNDLRTIVLSTAQHREMLDRAMSAFGVMPDVDLDVMRPNQTLGELTARMIASIQLHLAQLKPDLVVVQGDTTTVLATALAAFYCRVPVAHVEAGLRSGDMENPYPEEANRRLTSLLTAMHFAPTAGARDALLHEGVPADRIVVTGNTVVDALDLVLKAPFDWCGRGLPPLSPEDRLVVLTSHRRESFGKELENICLAVLELVQRFSNLRLIFPVHMNPTVRATVSALLADVTRVHLLEPLDYVSFINLLRRADLILTDSGGVQEEAPSLGKPLLVLRKVTERPEAFLAGLSRVIGTDREAIVSEVSRLLTDPVAYAAMQSQANPYGDGRAAERITRSISRWAHGDSPWLPAEEEFDGTVLLERCVA